MGGGLPHSGIFNGEVCRPDEYWILHVLNSGGSQGSRGTQVSSFWQAHDVFKTLRADSRPHRARTAEVSEMEVAI